jgi:hypothetical protein
MKCFNEERTQLICLANELNLPTHSPDVEREAIKLQYYFNNRILSSFGMRSSESPSRVEGIMRQTCFIPHRRSPSLS